LEQWRSTQIILKKNVPKRHLDNEGNDLNGGLPPEFLTEKKVALRGETGTKGGALPTKSRGFS